MRTYRFFCACMSQPCLRAQKPRQKIFDILKKTKKCRKVLHISKKSSTFAASKVTKGRYMATYALTINERSTSGRALLEYLEALKLDLQLLPKVRMRKSSYERSMDDIKHGRIEKFASADDMCKSLGI